MKSAQAEIATKAHRASRLSLKAFWTLYVLAAVFCIVTPQGHTFFGALCMGIYWLVLLVLRAPLQKFASLVIPPVTLRFFLVGLISSDLVMENLAINFKGDLHPNLIINSLLWLGSYLGSMLGWWIVWRRYRFTPYQAFFIAGLFGVLIEQNWMVPKLLLGGQWPIAFLAAPILLVVYGAAVAPAFLITGDHPAAFRKPGVVAVAMAFLLPALLFYAVGQIWIAFFRPFAGS